MKLEQIADTLVSPLTALVALWTGVSLEAVQPNAVRQAALRQLKAGKDSNDILRLAAQGNPEMVRALHEAVSVGETYFFRQPEAFEYLAKVVASRLAAGAKTLNVWSAGCATGEEAYSVAACLLATVPQGKDVSVCVVATDLLERSISTARNGTYSRWSVRGPMMYPVYRDVGGRNYRVHDEVLRQVTFFVHNLLNPFPSEQGAPFDVIFCRNVLVYFSPEAQRIALSHIGNALSPSGVLVLGPMDLPNAPLQMQRVGSHDLQVYGWPSPDAPPTPEPKLQPSEVPPAPKFVRVAAEAPRLAPAPVAVAPARRSPRGGRLTEEETISLHLKAMEQIERGEAKAARRTLEHLGRQAPDYLPGLLERALFLGRAGDRSAARELMRDVQKRASALETSQILNGPEPLPVEFYLASSEAFLQRLEEEGA